MSVLQNDAYAASYSIPGGVIAGSTVTLTVTAPDGTTSTPTVSQGATSTASVVAAQLGNYLLVWRATGTVTDVYQDQFTSVAPALWLMSLGDVKEQLNLLASDTTSNTRLIRFLASAKDVIEFITGPIIAQTRIDMFDGGSSSIVLPYRWVKSITSITETVGAITYTLTEQPLSQSPVDAWGYTWDRTTHRIVRRISGIDVPFMTGQQNIIVTSVLGMSSVPQVVQDACGELIRHWWSHGQTAYTAPFMPGDDGETPVTNVMGYAIPNRVISMLQPYARLASVV